MDNKVNWAKIKIPPFGMSDGMVRFNNGWGNEMNKESSPKVKGNKKIKERNRQVQ